MAREGTVAPAHTNAVRDRAADSRGLRRRGGRGPPHGTGQGDDDLGPYSRIQAGRPPGTPAARNLRPRTDRGGPRDRPPWHPPEHPDRVVPVVVAFVKDDADGFRLLDPLNRSVITDVSDAIGVIHQAEYV